MSKNFPGKAVTHLKKRSDEGVHYNRAVIGRVDLMLTFYAISLCFIIVFLMICRDWCIGFIERRPVVMRKNSRSSRVCSTARIP